MDSQRFFCGTLTENCQLRNYVLKVITGTVVENPILASHDKDVWQILKGLRRSTGVHRVPVIINVAKIH